MRLHANLFLNPSFHTHLEVHVPNIANLSISIRQYITESLADYSVYVAEGSVQGAL